MTSSFDPSSDVADIVDGLQAVTVDRRGSSADTSVAHALRRAITTREAAASNGLYTAADVRWHLPKAECPTAPRLGDVIVDVAGNRWTVLDVTEAALSTRWACAARNLAVVHGLDDTITIEVSVYSKGTGGAAERTWTTWRSGVRARIQPAAAEIGTEHQARRTAKKYQIFVAEDLALNHTHRVKGPDGTIYHVTGCTAAQRIGQLQMIEAEAV